MELELILEQLKSERDRLDRAIAALSGAQGPTKRDGRRRRMSAAARARIGAAMRARWAARKAGKAGGRRGMSPAARKRMSAMMKARWAARKKGSAA